VSGLIGRNMRRLDSIDWRRISTQIALEAAKTAYVFSKEPFDRL